VRELLAFGFVGIAAVVLAQERELTPMQQFRNAETYIGSHRWDLALESLDACLARDPSITEAYYLRATVREYFKLDEEALTDYNIYLELRPTQTEALFGRAQLRFRLKHYEEARADFIKLTYLPNTETNSVFFQVDTYTGGTSKAFTMQGADKAYIYNYLGQAETHLGHLDQAIQWFDSAIARVKGDPDFYVNRGIAKEKNHNANGAMRDFRQALRLDPNHALAKHHLGTASKSTSPDSATAMLNEAIADNPNMPFAFADRGYALMEKGKYREALADFNQAIRLDPSNHEYFLNRGLIREKLADPDGAYKDYTQAINLRGDFDKAWLNRGNLLFRRGKFIDAVEDYTVAITYNAGYSSAYYNRAIALEQLHQNAAACADLKTAEVLGHQVPDKVKRQICR
jgi:tetratricopeptide (TPR) repeat protein